MKFTTKLGLKVAIQVSLIFLATGSVVLDKSLFVFFNIQYPFFLAAIFNLFILVGTLLSIKWFPANRSIFGVPWYYHIKGVTASVSSILLMYLMYEGIQIETIQVAKTLLPIFSAIFPYYVITDFRVPYVNDKAVNVPLFSLLIVGFGMVVYQLKIKEFLLLLLWILVYSMDFFLDEKLSHDAGLNGTAIVLYSTLESLLLSLSIFFSFDGLTYMMTGFDWSTFPFIIIACTIEMIFSILSYCTVKGKDIGNIAHIGDYHKTVFGVVLVLSIVVSRSVFYKLFTFTPINYAGMGISVMAFLMLQFFEMKKRVFYESEEEPIPIDVNSTFSQEYRDSNMTINDLIDNDDDIELN